MASWFDLKGTTLNTFSIGIKKTKFDSSVVTITRNFKLPDAAVDMSGGNIGQVLGIISGTQIGWINASVDITGAASTIVTANLTASRAVISNASGKIDVSVTTSTELGYLSGVSSAIQTQLNGKQATITGAATTVVSSNLTASRAVISNASGKIDVSSVSSTELGYLVGVTSSIQTQIDNKEPTITGGASTIVTSNLTASRALVSNASGKVDVSTATSTEVGYLSGVSSSIQTQINGKEPSFTTLPISKGGTNSSTALNNNRIMRSSSDSIVEAAAITAARALISDANGIPTHSAVTSTELGYVSGVTSSIQTQLNNLGQVAEVAGETLLTNDYVYISDGTGNDSGRTAGRVYKVDPNFENRVDGVGFIVAGASAGESVIVKFSGLMSGFTGLSEGKIYYASPTTPGLITSTPPTANGQWILVPAIAASATQIIINPAASASAVLITSDEISFTFTNNQSTPANITGMIFDPISTKAFFVDYFIYRSTGSSGVAQSGRLRGAYNSYTSTWFMSDDYTGEDAGISFSILSSGQIQYTSTNIVGSTSTLKYAPSRTLS